MSGGAYFQGGFPLTKGQTYAGVTSTEAGFFCDAGTGSTVEARAVCRPARTDETVTVRPATSDIYHAYCEAGEVVL